MARLVRLAAPAFRNDFAHHAEGVARLNHGSFGATPAPVLARERELRDTWLAHPDAEYFSGALNDDLAEAAEAAGAAIGAPANTCALVDNASVAAAIVLKRWSKARAPSTLLLSCCYGGVRRAAEVTVGAEHIVDAKVAFPNTSHERVLADLDAALKRSRPKFALLDHITSQPAIALPVGEMVALCRDRGVEEVAVDGAHACGQVPVDVGAVGADFYWTNLHKWSFAGPVATAMHARDEASLTHVIPSWNAGLGLLAEARWTGTRDYTSLRAVPAALAYAATWRSAEDLDAPTFNALGLRQAAAQLRDAWGTATAYEEKDCFSSMGMVRLPDMDMSLDAPGKPATAASVRSRLRADYGVEAAVGGFPEDGALRGFLRLSHAVYTTDDDVARLKSAVLDLAGK